MSIENVDLEDLFETKNMGTYMEFKTALEKCLAQEMSEGHLSAKELPEGSGWSYEDMGEFSVKLPDSLSFGYIEDELSARNHPLTEGQKLEP